MNYVVHLLFLVFCLASAAYCNAHQDGSMALVKSEFCNNGPTVWCQNFTTASQCHAVKHCIQTVWSTSKIVESDDECSNCVAKITDIKQTINSNTTKEVIEELFDYVCELNPLIHIFRKTCEKVIHTYVTNHIDELLDLLSSDVAPETICKLFGMCSGQKNDIFPVLTEDVEEEVVFMSENVLLHFPAHDQIFRVRLPVNDEDIGKRKVAEKLTGSEMCTWGPSFWCGNLKNSKKCRATSHCIKNAWSKTDYPVDNDSVCQVCKDMVKQARDQLLSNETQEELKEVFEGSCKLIPIKEARKECDALADEFVPELTEMLASEMNPTAVCSVAGLCNNARIDLLLASHNQTDDVDFSGYDTCSNCTAAFRTYQNYIQTTSKAEVLDRILGVCDELSSYSDLCARLIRDNFDELYDTLKWKLEPFVGCHVSGMCAENYHLHADPSNVDFMTRVDTMVASKDDDIACDLCKQLVGHLKDVLTANTTEEEFHKMLQGVCEQTGNFRDECTKLVNDNYAIVYKFLTDELDPQKICTAVQICPKAPSLLTDERVNYRHRGMRIPVLSDDVELTALSPIKVANVECSICTSVVNGAEKLMQNPEYSKDVEKVLHDVCDYIPFTDTRACNTFVHTYIDTLITLLASDTDPSVICELMKLCTDVSAPAKMTTAVVVARNGELCPLCRFILRYVQKALDDPTDADAVAKELVKACALVPRTVRDECRLLVGEYSDLIINALAQDVDPSLVCPILKLCVSTMGEWERCDKCQVFMRDFLASLNGDRQVESVESKLVQFGSENAVAAELQVHHREDIVDMVTAQFAAAESCVFMRFCNADVADDTETNEIAGKGSCELCEMLVRVYEKELTSNKTEQELERMLLKFCNAFRRAGMRAECSKLVDLYLVEFLNALEQGVSPKELCGAIKLCSMPYLSSPNECTECELAVGAVEGLLGDPVNRRKLNFEISALCTEMSGKAREVCDVIVQQVLPQIEGLAFQIPPWFVCNKLKACSFHELVDDSVCSNVESQCASVKNAFQCDKLKLCKETAWKYSKPPSQ